MSEMEQQADKAKEATDAATKQKVDLSEYVDKLQHEIHKYERETV